MSVDGELGSTLARRAVAPVHGRSSARVSPVVRAREHAGLVTRALALALDALIIDSVALLVGVVTGLGLSVLHLPQAVDVVAAAILGAAFVAWSVGYFAFFWSSTGQTPGDRMMRVEVVDERSGGVLKLRRALLRYVGLILAIIPLFAGILMMLWDPRGRCLHDRLVHTVVLYCDPPE